MIALLVGWIVALLAGLIIFFIIGRFTGTEEYGGINTKDDERSRFIKQKAIVSSWVLLLMLLFINFVFDFFNLNQRGIKQLEYPELLYLLVLVVSYFVYYLIYSRRLSSNGK